MRWDLSGTRFFWHSKIFSSGQNLLLSLFPCWQFMGSTLCHDVNIWGGSFSKENVPIFPFPFYFYHVFPGADFGTKWWLFPQHPVMWFMSSASSAVSSASHVQTLYSFPLMPVIPQWPRNKYIQAKWSKTPRGSTILLTHAPPSASWCWIFHAYL